MCKWNNICIHVSFQLMHSQESKESLLKRKELVFQKLYLTTARDKRMEGLQLWTKKNHVFEKLKRLNIPPLTHHKNEFTRRNKVIFYSTFFLF